MEAANQRQNPSESSCEICCAFNSVLDDCIALRAIPLIARTERSLEKQQKNISEVFIPTIRSHMMSVSSACDSLEAALEHFDRTHEVTQLFAALDAVSMLNMASDMTRDLTDGSPVLRIDAMQPSPREFTRQHSPTNSLTTDSVRIFSSYGATHDAQSYGATASASSSGGRLPMPNRR